MPGIHVESISLHLGAHKTATTYIQQALEQSLDKLRASGVGYIPLAEMRPTITRSVGLTGFSRLPAARRALDRYRDCTTLILSDENILGQPVPARSGLYYPRRRFRLWRLLRRLPSANVRIFFAIRAYDSFVSAMYSEIIRHRPFVAPDLYLKQVDVDAFAWRNVIASFVGLVGAERVTVWRHEDFAAVQDRLFDLLTAGHGECVEAPDQAVRPSLSTEAVARLVALQSRLTPVEIRDQVEAVARQFPKGPDNPTFSAYDPDRAARLRERYAREASQLADDFPGIHFLAP